MSLLMFASKKSNTITVKAFLLDPNIQVYHRDQNGKNVVHYAIENQDENEGQMIVKQLMDQFPLLVFILIARKKWETIQKATISLLQFEKEKYKF